jgi:hypothetical protein
MEEEEKLRVGDFRPIACCNVLYKIIMKVIANRLDPYLQALIDPCQGAFVNGRNLSDNVMLAQEFV